MMISLLLLHVKSRMNTSSSSMLMLLAAVTITITTSLLLNLPLITADPSDGSLETDKEALLAFYRGLASGGTKLDWETNDDVCKWYGIYCTDEVEEKKRRGSGGGGSGGENRVVEVRLPGKGLYGAIAAKSIGNLHALQRLSLRENSLYGNLPPDILSIPTLKAIHLQKNKFCGDLPDFNKHPHNLEVVDFSFNSFSGTIPSVFGKTEELQYLDLQSNMFSGNIPDFDLKSIEELYLGHNMLEGPIPLPFQKFKESSFVGNPGLCGTPFPTPCSAISPAYAPLPNAAYSNKLGHHVALVASSLLLFLLLLL